MAYGGGVRQAQEDEGPSAGATTRRPASVKPASPAIRWSRSAAMRWAAWAASASARGATHASAAASAGVDTGHSGWARSRSATVSGAART